MADLVSILLPVYNAAPFLTECLDSIISQTENNWELLAVDDFSTDDSYAILGQYAAQDSRVQVLKNTEKGIIPALYKAYAHSAGNYITRMDADDRMSPEKLFLLKKALKENGKNHLATGLVQYFSETELGQGYQRYEIWLNQLTISSNNFSEIYKECVIPSPCWMLHRDDLDKCGAFDSDLYPEDYDLCFRFYKNQLKVVGVKQVLHYWRDHTTRTSRNDLTYANNQYFALKLPYFLKLDYRSDRPLILWGAGKKGKAIARILSENSIAFYWICNTPTKWGHQVFKTKMQSPSILKNLFNPQIIIAVAAPDDQKEIKNILEKNKIEKGGDYYLFC